MFAYFIDIINNTKDIFLALFCFSLPWIIARIIVEIKYAFEWRTFSPESVKLQKLEFEFLSENAKHHKFETFHSQVLFDLIETY